MLTATGGADGIVGTGDDAVYGYDASGGGRVVSIDRGSDDWTLSYNSAGQVIGVTRAGDTALSYEYDGLGRRTGATAGAQTYDYLIAPAAQRLGLDMEVQHLATSAGATVGWIYAGENPIMRFEGAPGNATISYYLEDATDSIRAVLNAAGTVTEEYDYDAFGNPLAGSDLPTSAAGGEFGFHGAWRDAETGLYHMRARTYDPVTGRFTTPDPADGDAQVPETFEPYSFANNNPHLYTDPTGMFTITEINVGMSVQGQIRNVRTIAVQQAKDYAKNKAYEFASDFLMQTMAKFIPGGAFLDFVNNRKGWDAGKQLHKDFKAVFEDFPFADMIWLEPSVDVTGKPRWDGLNVERGGYPNPFLGHSMPDFLVKPSGSKPTDMEVRGYLVGDIKFSAQTIWNDYFGKKGYSGGKNRQWLAITNYARKYQITPVTMFITWNPGTSTLAKKISAEAFMRGVAVVIVSLRPR